MPENTKVHKMAEAIERSGASKGVAIATAQKRTGQSYATGKKIARKPVKTAKRYKQPYS